MQKILSAVDNNIYGLWATSAILLIDQNDQKSI